MKKLVVLALLLCAVGCDKKSEEKPAEKPAETASKVVEEPEVTLHPLAPESPSTTSPDLATAMDFEQEAGKVVALENLEAELDRLEAEIESVPN